MYLFQNWTNLSPPSHSLVVALSFLLSRKDSIFFAFFKSSHLTAGDHLSGTVKSRILTFSRARCRMFSSESCLWTFWLLSKVEKKCLNRFVVIKVLVSQISAHERLRLGPSTTSWGFLKKKVIPSDPWETLKSYTGFVFNRKMILQFPSNSNPWERHHLQANKFRVSHSRMQFVGRRVHTEGYVTQHMVMLQPYESIRTNIDLPFFSVFVLIWFGSRNIFKRFKKLSGLSVDA